MRAKHHARLIKPAIAPLWMKWSKTAARRKLVKIACPAYSCRIDFA
jgi:hypothetical protein